VRDNIGKMLESRPEGSRETGEERKREESQRLDEPLFQFWSSPPRPRERGGG
jgi:hypothetical protein